MNLIPLIIQILVALTSGLAALMSILFFIRLRWPAPVLWFLKLYASALSPLLTLIGVVGIFTGLATASVFITILGIYDVLIFALHIYSVTRPPDYSSGFEKAFGLHWEHRINPSQKKYFLSGRFLLKLPAVPKSRMQQNIPFTTIPDTDRKLLCDLWLPPKKVIPSGMALIYLHGSAFYFLDKDLGTRPFFNHLAAQGHVIMDVAYRLSPETDMMGMVNDVKRAIVWIKENAQRYGVNPNHIVLGGASAGGHLAMLAGYTANNPKFTPKELQGKDIGVCAIISLYGTSDLETLYYHTNQHLTTRSTPNRPKKNVPTQMPHWLIKRMGKEYHRLGFDKGFEKAGALAPLLGGHPNEYPERYALFSPIKYVHADCPPTLLIHGEHDIMAPVKTTRILYRLLVKKKVPAILHILPQTDHAFDLQLPKTAPSAHNAIYDVERFMALMMLQDKI